MQQLTGAGILGTGHYVPERVLTNADLENMVDTSDEWIRTRTGIEKRHLAADNEDTSDLASKAAQQAMDAAGISPEEIDFIIVATASPDYTVPSTACMVQQKLGCTKAGGIDLSAGCAGFVYAVSVGSQMVRTGMYKKVLVIGAEVLSRVVNWNDRNTCILFGDGAGAAVLGPVEEGYGFLGADMGVDGSLGNILSIPASGVAEPVTHRAIDSGRIYIHMEGSEVFKAAVRHMDSTTLRALEKADMTKEDIDLLIVHQANYRIIQATAKKLDIPADKLFINIEKYGNTSAASVGIALDEAVRSGRVHHGDRIVMTGFGAGLAWGSVVMRWM
ncbi:MAG TPA: 3-oxoacyl-ACP synthase [Veillonellaceae bacterium]|jgi:3-oxoacyl-[acyl-carrier-protein] synthase-3|nr:3-oxoacyl-ACP synthase [Veillonellaceae bacterium]